MSLLKTFREKNKLTQQELGNQLGVSHLYISQIENNRVKLTDTLKNKILQNKQGWDISMFETDEELLIKAPIPFGTPGRRLSMLINYLQAHKVVLTDNEFAIRVGVTKENINAIRRDKKEITNKIADKIFSAFSVVNKDWLLTGEGDMLLLRKYATANDMARQIKHYEVLLLQKDILIQQQKEIIEQLMKK